MRRGYKSAIMMMKLESSYHALVAKLKSKQLKSVYLIWNGKLQVTTMKSVVKATDFLFETY